MSPTSSTIVRPASSMSASTASPAPRSAAGSAVRPRPSARAGIGGSAEVRAAALSDRVAGMPAEDVLRAAIAAAAPGRIAMVTSFGADSAVLLHMVARIDGTLPVIFLDTGKLFGETLRYRDGLVTRLGLTDVRTIEPDPADLQADDPDGILWAGRPDRCCYVRKVLPLQRALEGIDTWITGRKRFQGGQRSRLPLVESLDGRVKVNPLAAWTPDDMAAYFERHDLPAHPLKAEGYLSIGCMPCTDRASDPGDARSGRWAGRDKTECGIHLAVPAGAR